MDIQDIEYLNITMDHSKIPVMCLLYFNLQSELAFSHNKTLVFLTSPVQGQKYSNMQKSTQRTDIQQSEKHS